MPPESRPERPLVQIAGLHKSFGPVDVLRGIELAIGRGDDHGHPDRGGGAFGAAGVCGAVGDRLAERTRASSAIAFSPPWRKGRVKVGRQFALRIPRWRAIQATPLLHFVGPRPPAQASQRSNFRAC